MTDSFAKRWREEKGIPQAETQKTPIDSFAKRWREEKKIATPSINETSTSLTSDTISGAARKIEPLKVDLTMQQKPINFMQNAIAKTGIDRPRVTETRPIEKAPIMSKQEQDRLNETLKLNMPNIIPKEAEYAPVTRLPKLTEQQEKIRQEMLKSSIGQFAAGAYEGSNIARMADKTQQAQTEEKTLASQFAEDSKEFSNAARAETASAVSSIVPGIFFAPPQLPSSF